MPDGEVLHLLADATTGVPDPYVTRFTLATLRQSGSSSGTIKRTLEGIRIGLTFSMNGISNLREGSVAALSWTPTSWRASPTGAADGRTALGP
jgi:hypothetical protein